MRWTRAMVMGAFGVAGLAGALPGEASAQAYRRMSASFCTPITPTYQSVRSDSGAIGNGGPTDIRLVCPILDDGYLPKLQIFSALVDVYDGSATAAVDARTCVSFWANVGGACGPASATSSSGVGITSLSPSTATWNSYSTDYGYLVVNLPAFTTGTASSVHGYELHQ
ncbi:hypothetical protein [Melittangium boletus]|uniref:Secreted protein n=1 Tax=Melittangium boletus DSM 14713 TaxID=1294270 RepID=A0A250IIU8_9BACT|nr:hypothetical protein [Melittangium boletus]ATB30856.1 hypothetical protein MEBOL_004318 [Melittangium boletus DSM 14713]